MDWNSTKDRQLWKLLSSASNSKDLDWEAMSERFDVPLSFLLQQAAWLYERHFEGMRAQMKRLGAGASAAPSPRPEQQGEGSGMGSIGMQRKGSNGMFSKDLRPASADAFRYGIVVAHWWRCGFGGAIHTFIIIVSVRGPRCRWRSRGVICVPHGDLFCFGIHGDKD